MQDPRRLPLSTRDGSPIPNARGLERAPEIHRAAQEMHRQEHSGARLRSSSSIYNCVGLVFASRRTCVDIEYILLILERDGYRRFTDIRKVWIGDIVTYEDTEGGLTHAAVVVDVEPDVATSTLVVQVLSKWGLDGEYLHLIEDVPQLFGKPTAFWTERREVL